MKKIAMILGILCLGCATETKLWNKDYYFTTFSVRIQGKASLPAVKHYIGGSRGNRNLFLTIEERRKLCLAYALRNSQTKWLSLIKSDRATQAEWEARIKDGYSGNWARCLTRARIKGAYFDEPEGCRVNVQFPCHPQNY
ncbi:MAG: hypothetical protein HS115_00850 [Spirochaetales bacterium]|nr:hypothetical protein [Spirochaetales bacterium]